MSKTKKRPLGPEDFIDKDTYYMLTNGTHASVDPLKEKARWKERCAQMSEEEKEGRRRAHAKLRAFYMDVE